MDDMDDVTSPRTRIEKAKQLLYWLMRHSRTEYLTFLDALGQNQRHLYDILMQPVPERFKTTPVAGPDSRVVYQPPHAPHTLPQAQAQAPTSQATRPSQAQPVRPPIEQPIAPPNAQLMRPPGQAEMPPPAMSSRFSEQSGSEGYRGVSGPRGAAGQSAPATERRLLEWRIQALGMVPLVDSIDKLHHLCIRLHLLTST